MSEKELLYVEDALSHQQCIKAKCCTYSNAIQDQDLKQFVKTLETQSQQLYANLINLLK